jgi:hypothetical protein
VLRFSGFDTEHQAQKKPGAADGKAIMAMKEA